MTILIDKFRFISIGREFTQHIYYNLMEQENLDEVLGITRCVRCGHRLDGEIECPFCSAVSGEKEKGEKGGWPKWVYITACFFTSPLSLYFIIKTRRLSFPEKIFAFCGCLLWLGIYFLLNEL